METPALMSEPAVFLTRTAVRNVPPARAWSPAPSLPASAERSVSPEMTCTCFCTLTSGASVGESAKSAPSVVGHQAPGIVPFGTYTYAMRVGAVLPVPAIAGSANSDSNAGSAMHAPAVRKNVRRENAACRCASLLFSLMSVARRDCSFGTHLLEGRGFDDAHQQCGEFPIVFFHRPDDAVDGLHVVILGTTTQRVGHEFVGQGAIEVTPVARGQDLLELVHAVERLAGDQLARRDDRLAALGIAPLAERVEILERESDRVHAVVARRAGRVFAVH